MFRSFAFIFVLTAFVTPHVASSFMLCGKFLQAPYKGRSAMAEFHEGFVGTTNHPFVNLAQMRFSQRTRIRGFAGNAVNLIQGVRNALGLEVIADPGAVVRDMVRTFPDLNRSALLEPQLIHDVLAWLGKTEILSSNISIRTQAISTLHEKKQANWPNVTPVNSLEHHFRDLKPNEFKIVQLYFASRLNRPPKSDFTFILTRVEGDLLSVMVPSYPNLSFTLRRTAGKLEVTTQDRSGAVPVRLTKGVHRISIVAPDPDSMLYRNGVVTSASIPLVYSVTTVTVPTSP